MIIDVEDFIREERTYWQELEKFLQKMEQDSAYRMSVQEIKRFHYLYQRASDDLSKITQSYFAASLREYLESLVARGYAYIYELRSEGRDIAWIKWFWKDFPHFFRRHLLSFVLALSIFLAGAGFGGWVITFDHQFKQVVIPFAHLQGDPSQRVRMEEQNINAAEGMNHKGTFSALLMKHNIRICIFLMVLGITLGIGTSILLFYNGVILGAVALDYVLAGEGLFLLGWLLPHGAIEIPAVLISGQAGLVLAGALAGVNGFWGIKTRLRNVCPDLVYLIGGVALLLVWAALVESFFSQYHQPQISYGLKIVFGSLELFFLVLFLILAGKKKKNSDHPG